MRQTHRRLPIRGSRRPQYPFCDILAKNVWPESNQEETSDKPKWRDIFQNNWPAFFFKTVKAIKDKDWAYVPGKVNTVQVSAAAAPFPMSYVVSVAYVSTCPHSQCLHGHGRVSCCCVLHTTLPSYDTRVALTHSIPRVMWQCVGNAFYACGNICLESTAAI